MNINAPPDRLEQLSADAQKMLEALSKNIKRERSKREVSQRKLADELGLKGSSTVTHWEKLSNNPTLEMFFVLCGYFDKTPNEMCDFLNLKPPKLKRDVDEEVFETETSGGRGQPTASVLASESPPPQGEEVRKLRKQMLEMMQKLETFEH